jgi:hypothetical protein
MFQGPTAEGRKTARPRRFLRDIARHLAIILVTLGAIEIMLRVVDFRDLRDGYGAGYPIVFRHDPELGWSPVPNSVAEFHGSRTITVQHNSLGLRDIEPAGPRRPTVLFVGDSLVWGYDVEAGDRFTERLRMNRPDLKIINAGVPGYGTDQEYLLLNRVWDATQPDVVILMVCVQNDREDNTSNVRYGGYLKPYLEQAPDGQWRFSGQPVPWSRFAYFNSSALVRASWLARLGVSAFVQLRYPVVSVTDPTERVIRMMRDLVEARSGKFMVGLQYHDAQLESFLQAQGI